MTKHFQRVIEHPALLGKLGGELVDSACTGVFNRRNSIRKPIYGASSVLLEDAPLVVYLFDVVQVFSHSLLHR